MAAIGTRTFVEEYVTQKAIEWTKELERLSSIAISQPHAAYSAFIHGIVSKWTYLARTIPDIADLLMPLEITIRYKFLPAITGQPAISDTERNLLALHVCLGGLGILDPVGLTAFQHESSQEVTKPLTALILRNTTCPANTRARQQRSKAEARKTRQRANKIAADNMLKELPKNLQMVMQVNCEKGASSWRSTLPISEHDFALHKGAFRDVICLRYGWRPPNLPSSHSGTTN